MILNCHSDRFIQTPSTDYLRFKPFCITKDCVFVIWYINVATVELFNPANRQMAKLHVNLYKNINTPKRMKIISFNHAFIPFMEDLICQIYIWFIISSWKIWKSQELSTQYLLMLSIFF